MNKQGSALIIALVLMLFITTLGTIVFLTAQKLQALSIERNLQRPPQILLESLIVYACQAQGVEWLKMSKKTRVSAATREQLNEFYAATINGTVCTLHVGAEKGVVVVRASCAGKRGITHTVSAQLEAEGERAVICAWQRS